MSVNLFEYREFEPELIIRICASLFIAILHIVLLILICYKTCCKHGHIPPAAKICVVAIFIARTIAFTARAIQIYSFASDIPETTFELIIFSVYWLTIYNSAVLMYIFYLLQLWLTFKCTVYKLSNCFIRGHKCIIAITIILTPTPIVFFYLDRFELASLIQSIAGFILVIPIGNVIHVMNKKLFSLVLEQQKSDGARVSVTTQTQHSGLLKVITRLTVLFTWGISTVIICIIAGVMDGIMNNIYTGLSFIVCYVSAFTFICLCEFLTLSINVNCYYSLFGKCDKKCHTLCQNCADKKLMDDINDKHTSMDMRPPLENIKEEDDMDSDDENENEASGSSLGDTVHSDNTINEQEHAMGVDMEMIRQLSTQSTLNSGINDVTMDPTMKRWISTAL